jgi:putative heme-binding domain-containing protein
MGDEVSKPLDARLLLEERSTIVREARESGDPIRGALVFFRPSLQCARCHTTDTMDKTPALGPDLAGIGQMKADRDIVESILEPSKQIRKGFEIVTIATRDGKLITGLIASERPDAIVVRDPARDGGGVTIPRAEIDEMKMSPTSLMPSGLVNQLADRREFLDLVRYLLDISEGGPARALALRPPESAFAVPPLPEYERNVDHAGIIASLDDSNFDRGKSIYERVCANCHGTIDKAGSLPTSLRFASGSFKNGSDPFRMYQTLSHGFGQMVPQTWMVPEQKYNVIHYIREAYLKPSNPTQYVKIDEKYLAGLPKGTTRGPRPIEVQPWITMDYGPSLALTCEVGDDETNFAYKGVAVRLDVGPGGVSRGRVWSVFEHDTLRFAAGWTGNGFIDWNGINFNGRHEIHPKISGVVEFANPNGLGWANPETGSFDDPRQIGRDARRYGPLPRSWGHYRGQYRHGDQVIFAYTIGHTSVLESPTAEMGSTAPVFHRAFNIGPRDKSMVLQVARRPNGRLRTLKSGTGGEVVLLGPEQMSTPVKLANAPFVRFDGKSHIELTKPIELDTSKSDYSIASRFQTTRGGSLFSEIPSDGRWIPGGILHAARI